MQTNILQHFKCQSEKKRETQVSHKKILCICLFLYLTLYSHPKKKYLYEHFPFELSYYIVGWINIHAMYIKVKCIIKKSSHFFGASIWISLFPFFRLSIHFMLVVVLKRRRQKKSIECKNYGTAEWERKKKFVKHKNEILTAKS